MGDQGIADDGPRTGDVVEYPGRQARPGQHLGKHRAAAGRCGRGGHPDDGVARGHGRREQLGAHGVGPVPRAHHGDDAQWHPGGHDAAVCRGGSGQPALAALGVLPGHPEVLGQLVDLVVRLGGQRLALVLGQGAGQLLAAFADPGDDLLAIARAVEGGGGSPGRPGGAGGGDGVVDVGRGAGRHRRERLARRRADGRRRAAVAVAPGPVDVQQVLPHSARLSLPDVMPQLGQALGRHPVGRAGNGQGRHARPRPIEHRRSDGDESLLQLGGRRRVAIATDRGQLVLQCAERRDRVLGIPLKLAGNTDGAVGEQHLAVGDGMRLRPAAGPAARAAQDVRARQLSDIQDVIPGRHGEVDRLARLPGELIHGRLHRRDHVEAAKRQRAQPDQLDTEPVTLAGPDEEPGSLQRGGQPGGGGLMHPERIGHLGDADLGP